jgi:hypothetical protein
MFLAIDNFDDVRFKRTMIQGKSIRSIEEICPICRHFKIVNSSGAICGCQGEMKTLIESNEFFIMLKRGWDVKEIDREKNVAIMIKN